MKNITKERLLNTLNVVNARSFSRQEPFAEVLSHLGTYGLRSMIHTAHGQDYEAPEKEKDVFHLKKCLTGIKIDSEADLHTVFDERSRICDHYRGWLDRIKRIQQKHEVSGLIETSMLLPNGIHLTQSEEDFDGLWLIDKDLDTLRSERPKIVAAFVEYLKNKGINEIQKELETTAKIDHGELSILKKAEVKTVSVDEIGAISSFFDWANLWMDDDFTPAIPVLRLGNGLDTHSLRDGNISYAEVFL